MKHRLLAAATMLILLCNLCSCGGSDTPFRMSKEKGYEGYVCCGFTDKNDASEAIVIPGSYQDTVVSAIGEEAFENQTGLREVTLSEGIEQICEDAFSGCTNLQVLTLPESLTHIGFCAFEECSALKKLWIPAQVDTLGVNAFSECTALEQVVILGPVSEIPSCAFLDCTSLKVIWLPASVEKITDNAFKGCDSLTEIHFAGTAEEFLSIDFGLSWMTAENVLVCCSDNNIFYENRFFEDYTDRDGIWPHDPTEDWSDPGPDETMPTQPDGNEPEDSGEDTGDTPSDPDAFVNTSSVTRNAAPYSAVAMAHDDWIYYFDEDSNLVRADADMEHVELFCQRPLDAYLDNDLDSINMIGVSDTDVMYYTGGGRSFVIDLTSGVTQELIAGDSGEQIRLYGMCGEWIYYTRTHSSDTLRRCRLPGDFDNEDTLFSGDLKDIYVTDRYLVCVMDDGTDWSLYCAPIEEPYEPLWRDGGSGDYNTIHLVGADGSTVVYYKGGSYVLEEKFYSCDLYTGSTQGGTKYPPGIYTYVGDDQRIYFLKNLLCYVKLEEIEGTSYYSNPDAYESDIDWGWRLVRAGDWFFFREDNAGGGAEYCVDYTGEHFRDLTTD